MIEVTYHRAYSRVTVKGHAYSGEPGHDLVCAGATALTYTLADRVIHLAENAQAREPVTVLEEGKAEISCNPNHKFKAAATIIFDTICAGYELLAHNFPDNISFEILHG